MKSFTQLFIAGLLALAISFSYAGEKKISKKQVPAAVLAAFEKAYPSAKAKGYAEETENGKTFFEIESVEGKTRRDILFTKEGKIEEIEESVAFDSLPDAVKATVKKEYPKGSISTAEKTIHGATIRYEVHLTSGKTRHEVVLEPDGKLVKQSKVEAKKDSEEEED